MIRNLFAAWESGTSFPLLVLLEVTLLLGIAALATAALRRQSAAARHFVWAGALCGALVLPGLARIAPHWNLPLPGALARFHVPAPRDEAALGATSVRPTSAGRDTARRTAMASNLDGKPNAGGARAADAANDVVAGRATRSLAALWLAGCVAVLGVSLLGHVGLARLARSATPLTDASWTSLLATARRRIRLASGVRLCRSAAVGSPVTWGWPVPLVVLPATADAWPVERRSAALEHELAHVARRDYLIQLGALVACAVYWFHPLVWFAARRLRAESELACDDRVVVAGTNAPDYATHLLEVARGARALRLAGAVVVCMARPSHLEGRLLAVLDEARARGGLALRVRLLAFAAFALLLLPIAGLRPIVRPALAADPDAGLHRVDKPTDRDADDNAAADVESTFVNVVDVEPGELLTLDLRSGGTVVLDGWDQKRVEVHGSLGGPNWRDTRVIFERDGDRVRLESWQARHRNSSSTSHRFEIHVPKRCDVRLQSAGGGVTITGVEGTFRGQTGGGDLVLENVKGEIHLSTGGGEMRITDVDASGSVSTGGGMVRLSRVRGGLQASSGSGPVIRSDEEDDDSKSGNWHGSKATSGDLDGVRIDAGNIRDERTEAHGVLSIQRAGGDVVLETAPHGARIQTGGGEIRVGRAAGLVEASTGGGKIEIGPVTGSVVAGTGAGEVRVTVAAASGEEQNIEISSGTGRVFVELPADFDGEFDLETAYTRGRGATTRIDSDFQLQRDESQDWDDDHGSPRRYVRAHGKSGSGRGLVHVRTVNGDIVVKRGGGRH